MEMSDNLVMEIIDYENGEMTGTEITALFSKLIKTGMINQLQGSYQRAANCLVEQGILNKDGSING
jgi:hypothetical protein